MENLLAVPSKPVRQRKLTCVNTDDGHSDSEVQMIDERVDMREIEVIKFGQKLKAGKYNLTTNRCLAFLKALYKYYSTGHEKKSTQGNG